MLTKLQRLANRARVDDSDGFTLIELLIVVVIIGILAAIAIPQFSSTKEKAYDAQAKSDLRNLMTAQEGHYANFQQYASNIVTAGASASSTQLPYGGSQNVNLQIAGTGGTPPDSFEAQAYHGQSDNCFKVNVGGTADGTVTQLSTSCSF